jgi:hypothetical protein
MCLLVDYFLFYLYRALAPVFIVEFVLLMYVWVGLACMSGANATGQLQILFKCFIPLGI